MGVNVGAVVPVVPVVSPSSETSLSLSFFTRIAAATNKEPKSEIFKVKMSTTALLQSTESALFAHYQISHTPPHPVTHMVASNMQIALVLANK